MSMHIPTSPAPVANVAQADHVGPHAAAVAVSLTVWLFALVCVCMQLLLRPLVDTSTQHLQTVLLLCVTIVAIASVPDAERAELAAGAAALSSTAGTAFADSLRSACEFVIPVVALLCSYALPVLCRRVKLGPLLSGEWDAGVGSRSASSPVPLGSSPTMSDA